MKASLNKFEARATVSMSADVEKICREFIKAILWNVALIDSAGKKMEDIDNFELIYIESNIVHYLKGKIIGFSPDKEIKIKKSKGILILMNYVGVEFELQIWDD